VQGSQCRINTRFSIRQGFSVYLLHDIRRFIKEAICVEISCVAEMNGTIKQDWIIKFHALNAARLAHPA